MRRRYSRFLKERQEGVIHWLIRAGREDQAMMTTLAGIVVVLFIIISMISQFFSAVKTMFML